MTAEYIYSAPVSDANPYIQKIQNKWLRSGNYEKFIEESVM